MCANNETFKGCRSELKKTLSDWIALGLKLGLKILIIDGINLNEINQSVISV
ncbi:hypothetical protein GM3709_876 [Geminocystis sp. NIES-3709]|nr:hypothetical protein GM3709_876 [Geminocystis sp. NIES-3709]